MPARQSRLDPGVQLLSILSAACRAHTPASGRKSRFSLPAGDAADATVAPEPHAPANTPTPAEGECFIRCKSGVVFACQWILKRWIDSLHGSAGIQGCKE